MKVNSMYPVIAVSDVAAGASFLCDWFDFEPTFASDWYVSLVDPEGREVAVLDSSHPTIPAGFRRVVQGMLLNFEVPDVDVEWERLVVRGRLEPLLSVRTEAFGQRHFIIKGPEHLMIDIISVIPATGEYVDKYTDLAR